MAYGFTPNETPTTGAHAVALLVARLLTEGWVGHAYGNGAGRQTDFGAFDVNDLVDISGAWVAVKMPGGSTRTWIFQRSTDGAGTNQNWWVAWCEGGLNADGDGNTVDTPATGGDTKDVHGTEASPAQLFPPDNGAGAFRFSCGADDAAPYGAWAAAWNMGTGESRTLLLVEPATVHGSDASAYVLHARYGAGGEPGSKASLRETTYTRTWYKRGLGGAAWAGAGFPNLYGMGGNEFPSSGELNPYDGKDDLYFPFIVTDQGGSQQYKGIALQTAYNFGSRPTAHTFDPAGAGDDRVQVGDVTLPWPAGVAAVV